MDSSAIIDLLRRIRRGDEAGLEELIPVVYRELRTIARRQRRRHSRPSELLNTTALVNEAYLRLARSEPFDFENRAHFLAVAATAMRQLLVDEARRRRSLKRGQGVAPITLEGLEVSAGSRQAELVLSIDHALEALGDGDPRLRQVVECRYFGGLTEEETAAALGVSDRTVRRDWIKARAWLRTQLAATS